MRTGGSNETREWEEIGVLDREKRRGNRKARLRAYRGSEDCESIIKKESDFRGARKDI